MIYCGRPTHRGNPFNWRLFGIARSVRLYAQWVDGRLGALTLERLGFSSGEIDALTRMRARLLAQLDWLRGKRLSCWCPENAPYCHVKTVLLPLANGAAD